MHACLWYVCTWYVTVFLGRHEQIAPHPRYGVYIHQSKDIVKVQFGEPNSFIGITHNSMCEGLFTGAESLQAAQLVSSASSMQLGWYVSFRWLSLFESVLYTTYVCSGIEGPSKSGQFLGLPKIFELFTSWVNEPPLRMEYFISEKISTQHQYVLMYAKCVPRCVCTKVDTCSMCACISGLSLPLFCVCILGQGFSVWLCLS